MTQKCWVMDYPRVEIEIYKIRSLFDNLLDLVENGEMLPSVAEMIALNLVGDEENGLICSLFDSFALELANF